MIQKVGDTVRDVVTGYAGVVMSRTEYLFGCVRLRVQSRELQDGKPVQDEVFDEQQVERLDVVNVLDTLPPSNAPGGTRPEPPMQRSEPRY